MHTKCGRFITNILLREHLTGSTPEFTCRNVLLQGEKKENDVPPLHKVIMSFSLGRPLGSSMLIVFSHVLPLLYQVEEDLMR